MWGSFADAFWQGIARGSTFLMLANRSIRAFLKELSSGRPVPGGGSASCIAGSMAAALISMACEISLRHEGSRVKKRRLKKLGGSPKF